ncbi:MAG: sugar ABC transporter substrate-binding protein [Actinobacteria bacterium]|nr:sugar ABC transporter substrate-binding protein [Actinomycetota bacterium]
MTPRTGLIGAVAGLAAGALLLTACSSSGGSGGSTGSNSGSNSSGGSSSSGSGSSKYAALQTAVTQLEQRPTTIGITDPIKGKIPAGKKVAFIQCGSPICSTMGNDLTAAGAILHWNIQKINAGLTAETIKAAWDQAVSSKVDAVITSGTPRTLFESELAQLKAANVPVIDLTTADGPGNGLTQVYGGPDQYSQQGKNMADYMLVNSGDTTVKELSVTISAYPNITLVANGLNAELKGQCSSCTTSDLDVPATSIGSDLPTRITSYLSSHPDINWVYVGFSDMVTGLPAALNSAGLGKVKIVTLSTNPTIATYMKNGQNLMMATGFDTDEMMWRSADYLARIWTNSSTAQNVDPKTLPSWFVTKDNLPSTTENFPYVADYRAQYEKLWTSS